MEHQQLSMPVIRKNQVVYMTPQSRLINNQKQKVNYTKYFPLLGTEEKFLRFLSIQVEKMTIYIRFLRCTLKCHHSSPSPLPLTPSHLKFNQAEHFSICAILELISTCDAFPHPINNNNSIRRINGDLYGSLNAQMGLPVKSSDITTEKTRRLPLLIR